METTNFDLEISLLELEASFGKLIYSLNKYPTLNLSFPFKKIIKVIYITKQNLVDNNKSIDIRDVKELENDYQNLKNKVYDNQKSVVRMGNNLACDLFLVQPLILKVLNLLKNVEIDKTYLDYYEILSKYVYMAARYVNQSLGIDEVNY